MSRRKKTSSKKQSKILIYAVWILAVIAVFLGSFIAGYYIGHDSEKKEIVQKAQAKEQKKASMLKKLEDMDKKELDINDRLKEVLKKDSKAVVKEQESVAEYEDASHEVEGEVLPIPPKREIVKSSSKPKLAIIIDDVSVRAQVDAIKSLNLPITMSFLPPSKHRPNSHTLASKESFYMVHLPMEAKSFTKEEPFTLKVDDSQEIITYRIAEIKKLFPKVKYINNHTGSKFTSDENAVKRLIYALDKQNINFIDSRTIGNTKVPAVMKNYGKKYISRDIFLDHEFDKEYVKGQIKKAVAYAKAHGSAIAIGHPHSNTILAIDESKKLFADVELVLIERFY
ncbi:MAG: divergent polysaccharide deacetylase family protein [Sulfurimonas sp.]